MTWLCHSCVVTTDLSLWSKVPVKAPPKKKKQPANSAEINTPDISASQAEGPKLDEENKNDPVKTTPCIHLANGRCLHGMSGNKEIAGKKCPYFHRKICRKYKVNGLHPKYGCKKGKDCPKLHPKICEGSRRKRKERVCTTENCPHLHLKGTRRHLNFETKEKPERPDTRKKKDSELPLSGSPIRPASQEKPELVQSGFLTQFLKEVRSSREASLRQADRMDEILSQLTGTQEDSIVLPVQQSQHYVLPPWNASQNQPLTQHTLAQNVIPAGMQMTQGMYNRNRYASSQTFPGSSF